MSHLLLVFKSIALGGAFLAGFIATVHIKGDVRYDVLASSSDASNFLPPIHLSGLLAIAIFSKVITYSRGSKISKFHDISYFIICFLIMVLTFSRTGTIAIAIGLITYGLMSKNNRKAAIISLLFLIPAGMVFYKILNTYTGGAVVLRYTENLDSHRIHLMKSSIEIFFDNIILGIGAGNFGHALVERGMAPFYIGSHNPFLKYFVEAGILGGSLFSAYFFLLTVNSFLSNKRIYILPLLFIIIIIASSIDFKLVLQLYLLFIISLVINNSEKIKIY